VDIKTTLITSAIISVCDSPKNKGNLCSGS
jgi:hypothetical protein